MRPVGSLFFPLDQRLELGGEGYSPRLLRKVVRQGAMAASFAQASGDLKELADLSISASHVRRLTERIGREWKQQRDQQIEQFRHDELACAYKEPPRVAAVMLDGGRIQMRAEDQAVGVHDPAWRETKVACCLTLTSQERATDPQPEPPKKFLDPVQVKRLAAEIHSRGRAASGRGNPPERKPQRRRKNKRARRPQKRVRTVVASTANSEEFGWQVAAEVQRRGLGRARRKACVCDGQHYNWSIYEMHLVPLGFVPILDVVHLLGYLYAAAHAAVATDPEQSWQTYERWLRWAWAGKVKDVLKELRAASAQRGKPARDAPEHDPKRILAEAVTYVKNNRERMDYPQYRCQGLPISSAPVESVIKQLNRRVKGTEKFWIKEGGEAVLQVRAAYLSEDDRAERYWAHPRPYARAAGKGRLRPVS